MTESDSPRQILDRIGGRGDIDWSATILDAAHVRIEAVDSKEVATILPHVEEDSGEVGEPEDEGSHGNMDAPRRTGKFVAP